MATGKLSTVRSNEDFYPDDMEARRQIVNNALRQARERWYNLELSYRKADHIYRVAKKKELRAQRNYPKLGDNTAAGIETQLANLEVEREGIEIEIKELMTELDSLGGNVPPAADDRPEQGA